MKIDVTAEDIEQGNIRSSDRCPVARAISRAVGKPVWVGAFHVCRPYPMPLPEFVSDNIMRMAKGEYVEPFSFDLEIP